MSSPIQRLILPNGQWAPWASCAVLPGLTNCSTFMQKLAVLIVSLQQRTESLITRFTLMTMLVHSPQGHVGAFSTTLKNLVSHEALITK